MVLVLLRLTLRMALVGLVISAVSRSQEAAQKPQFEVASVKPSPGLDQRGQIGRPSRGRFTAANVTLKLLIQNAYRIRDFQLIGGPNWIATDRWNIEAHAEDGTVPAQTGPVDPNSPDAMSLRVQSLLEDRFKLKLHRETRELPIYTLSIAKGGSKLKIVEAPPPRLAGQRPSNAPLPGGLGIGPANLVGNAITMAQFIAAVSGLVGRSIADRTSIRDHFDVQLSFAPESTPGNPVGTGGASTAAPVANDPAPSIFTALQEQLRLKLESARGPVEVLIIDNVERPSEN